MTDTGARRIEESRREVVTSTMSENLGTPSSSGSLASEAEPSCASAGVAAASTDGGSSSWTPGVAPAANTTTSEERMHSGITIRPTLRNGGARYSPIHSSVNGLGSGRRAPCEGWGIIGTRVMAEKSAGNRETDELATFVGWGNPIARSTPYHAWQPVFARYFATENVEDTASRRDRVLARFADRPDWLRLAPLVLAHRPGRHRGERAHLAAHRDGARRSHS